MKKFLLVGALAASMALSSSAFAAVSYGDADTLQVSYDGADRVSVTTDLSATDGRQMTVLVLNGDGSTVAKENIMYIDQEAAPTEGNIFQDMGLLMPNGATTLPVGTYTVKVGTDAADASILVATINVTEDGRVVDFVFGDVNGDGSANTSDGMAIIAKIAGGPVKVGEYEIGTKLADGYVIGDVNDDGNANTSDGMAIIAKIAGGPVKVGTYDIGYKTTVTIK